VEEWIEIFFLFFSYNRLRGDAKNDDFQARKGLISESSSLVKGKGKRRKKQ